MYLSSGNGDQSLLAILLVNLVQDIPHYFWVNVGDLQVIDMPHYGALFSIHHLVDIVWVPFETPFLQAP